MRTSCECADRNLSHLLSDNEKNLVKSYIRPRVSILIFMIELTTQAEEKKNNKIRHYHKVNGVQLNQTGAC